jgi:hypothetical protein
MVPHSPFAEVIKENNLKVAKEFRDANIILFSDFSYIDQNIGSIRFREGVNYYIYGIRQCDELASKSRLATYMKNAGRQEYIPRSYVLHDTADMQALDKDHVDGSTYMLKKNLQRQEGNLITQDFAFIKEKAARDGYVVCQELLQNPYIVGGRKINLRVYMLIVVQEGTCKFYMYRDGFMYYTPKMFEKGSTERDVNITTGYIDRKVYEENPLTIQDLYRHLGSRKAGILQENIRDTLSNLRQVYETHFIESNISLPGVKFNIFGVDIAPDENLKTTIMEVNKGPDLSYKDDRDRDVKLNMVFDCFALVNLSSKGVGENFIKL